MNETPLIRLAEERDVPRIVDLYRELTISDSAVEHSRNPSLADYQLIFAEIRTDPGQKLFVAEVQREVVGTIELLIIPNLSHNGTPFAFLENLIVTEKHRRRGLGRMLLEHVVSLARESGCHMVELCSDARRKEAHKLYDSMGFQAQAHCFRLYFWCHRLATFVRLTVHRRKIRREAMKSLLKKYLLYLTRWQLSTPILALCVVWFATLGTTVATVLANLIGGLIFFWVDIWIFQKTSILKGEVWEVQQGIVGADCGQPADRGTGWQRPPTTTR